MIQYKQILITLALLLTAVTGAWAQATFEVKEITADMVPADWNGDNTIVSPEDLATLGITFFEVTKAQASAWADYPKEGTVRLLYAYSTGFSSVDWYNGTPDGDSWNFKRNQIYVANATGYRYFVTVPSAAPEPGITVEPVEGKTNEWTFSMPAFDVEIAPIYAPTAKWATEGDKVLAPTAIEGIFAGTEDAIVKAGTVVEGQGTAMYFATTDAEMTAEKAAAADGWLSTLPTAAGYDDATTVYVWYYIKGADTPDGQEASAENTFNDLEICATPIKVEVLSNKFDIEFKAANANTIKAGKATVTVGGTPATVTDGKLEGVKMNSKVTVTAKDGYKFRKVEVKKAGPKTITIGGSYSATLDIEGCTTWQQVVEKNSTRITIFVDDFITDPDTYHFLMKGNNYVAPGDNIDPTATDYTFVNAQF